jgi:beta-galactosidase
MRKVININQKWKFINDGNAVYENVLKRKSSNVNLPHTWNNLDGQDGGNDYWRRIEQRTMV